MRPDIRIALLAAAMLSPAFFAAAQGAPAPGAKDGDAAGAPPPMPAERLADPAEILRIAAGVTAECFPDADVAMLDDRIHVEYAPDGTETLWDDEWVKILTERGRRSQATLALDVSLRYGDAAIEKVEIFDADGKAREVDFRKTLKMATDNFFVSANIYDPMDKRLVCAVPSLAVGEIRHVRFCRRMLHPRMRGTWATSFPAETTYPILHAKFTVDQPDGLPLAHAAVRHPFQDTVTRLPDVPLGGGRTLLAWEVRDVPQAFPEPSMPPMASVAQSLRLSTAADWPTVSRWYWNLCEPHMAAGNADMTNKVSELAAGRAGDEEKIRALFRFVSQEIRYMGITTETEAPGAEPHDVGMTFSRRHGVCRDKAVLLAAMLRIAGIDARPVLIHVGEKKDPEIPSPYFNHAITGVRAENGGWKLMDPTDEAARNLLPSYLSDCSYLVATPGGEPLRVSPVAPVEENMLSVKSGGTLEPGGFALVSSEFSFGGINDTAFRHLFVRETGETRRRTVEALMRQAMPGAELLSCEISPADLSDTGVPLSMRTIARFPGTMLHGKTHDAFELPMLTRAFSIVKSLVDGNTALQKRRFPLEFSYTAGTDETLTLQLGEETGEPARMPPDVDENAADGAYSYGYSVAVSNRTLTARRRQSLAGIRFSPEEYDALRDCLKLQEGLSRDDPVFDAKKDANADVRAILNRQETVFSSPFAWTTTNTVVKEVLTYQGKKSSAELKFAYNPAVRSVEILSATVSNRNGQVRSLSPEETNLLDAGWAASAPRYPASKILVANLPGVEIGSVIRYVTVHTVTNAPVAYSSFSLFDSTQPAERMTVKLSMPEDMPFRYRSTGFSGGREGMSEFSGTAGGIRRYAWSAANPERIANEPSQPAASRWRVTLFATAAEWKPYAGALVGALEDARNAGSGEARSIAREITAGCETPQERIAAIRKYIARHIRSAGPGLFDIPFDRAFFPPDRSIADSYASAADRQNLAFAMLEAAGFECSFVLAADDALGEKPDTLPYCEKLPRPTFFGRLAVRARAGGRVFFVARENEYVPPDASSLEGCTFFDPQDVSFGEVRLGKEDGACVWKPWTWFGASRAADVPGASEWSEKDVNFCRMTVHEDGGVDFAVRNLQYGPQVGGFRKSFKEILPEKRSRFYQMLLGEIAENASATSELKTDTDGYPAEISFSAFVPAYASARDGEITVKVPDFDDPFVSLGGPVRKTPISVGGATETIDTYEIAFPKNHTAAERMPEPYILADPATGRPWMEFSVQKSFDGDGRLVVVLTRRTLRRSASTLGADYFPFLREWNRRISAPEGRSVTVRRAEPGNGGGEKQTGNK